MTTAPERHPLLVRVPDGGICVPPSIEYLTTYVLLEQEDWFEKEIRFIRRVLQPGMRTIDVGANYGVYTLAMARAVGPGGHVWAFEPAEQTLRFLRSTLAANQLQNVAVCPIALSKREGSGFLSLQSNSELNSLVTASAAASTASASSQPVALSTLDLQHSALSMGSIDFVKLDAEGEEVRILEGSPRFFGEQSPLVMFELKAGNQLNVELPRTFRELGYGIFRLLGPDTLLAPVDPADSFDAYELNLFACKPDRAHLLARRGLLAEAPAAPPLHALGSGLSYWRDQPFAAGWPVADDAALQPAENVWADHYAAWRNADHAPAARIGALQAALRALAGPAGAPVDAPAGLVSLANRARLLLEAGARQPAVQALTACLARAAQGAELGRGIVWPPSPRYDGIRPVGAARDWLLASVVEAQSGAAQFSDYFARTHYLPALDWLQSTPYANAPMERRRQLQSIRAHRRAQVSSSIQLTSGAPDHLNPDLWSRPPPR